MSALPPDPWKALGVEKTSDKAQIRTAYRKLVLKCHPDKVQDPELKAQKQEEFQKVQQAYELLNDDTALQKYEDQLRQELRKQAAAFMAKNKPNTSSARTPSKPQTYYSPRTAEAKFKATPTANVFTFKVRTGSPDRARMAGVRIVEVDEERARTKSSRREDEQREREDRRRRKEDDARRERERLRDQKREQMDQEFARIEREMARERRKAEKTARDKDVNRDRKAKAEAAAFQPAFKSPYVESSSHEEDEVYSAKEERKKSRSSSSKKRTETKDKSSRRERTASPTAEARRAPAPPLEKEKELRDSVDEAVRYIRSATHRGGVSLNRSYTDIPSHPLGKPTAPSPPPVLDAAMRAAERRSSEEATHKSKSRRPSKDHDAAAQYSSRDRRPPAFSKSHTTLLMVPETPPRPSRTYTAPEAFAQPPPQFSRTSTWTPGDDHIKTGRDPYPYGYDQYDDLARHSSRTQYTVGANGRTARMDPYYSEQYHSTSRRYDAYDDIESPYASLPVREAKRYTYDDVQYSDFVYSTRSPDPYAVPV